MKNVLLIGSELGKGGAERSISLLSYYLQQRQYKVTLCLLSGIDRERYYKTCDDVVFVDPPAHNNILDKIKAWRYRIQRIKKLKKEKQTDIAISFLEGPDYVNILTKGKEKVVLSIRGTKLYDKQISGYVGIIRRKILIPFLYRNADQIVCVTEALATELQQHFGIHPRKLKTIYNFYETDVIRQKALYPLTDKEQQLFTKPAIIASGRLHMAKEFDKLITVFHEYRKTHAARLLILGDGEKKQQLMQLASSLNMEACDWQAADTFREADIYFLGYQSNAFKFYHHSQLFALPSSWEGFPNVLAEALYCGLPVVASDCHTGPREILHITGLSDTRITKPIHTDIGCLLPLLQPLTTENIHYWKDAICYWLHAPVPEDKLFLQRTERFAREAILSKWEEVINDR